MSNREDPDQHLLNTYKMALDAFNRVDDELRQFARSLERLGKALQSRLVQIEIDGMAVGRTKSSSRDTDSFSTREFANTNVSQATINLVGSWADTHLHLIDAFDALKPRQKRGLNAPPR